MKILIKTFEGLEDVLEQELLDFNMPDVVKSRRLVTCTGDLADIYKLNLGLHTAVRILTPIYEFEIDSQDDFYNQIQEHDWEQYFEVDDTFAIDAVINTEIFSHSKYTAYRMKDAIVDKFRDQYGRRPSIDTQYPDARFNVHINREKVTVSLDSSGESLHKRGYRVDVNEAPLNEVLAAGIIKMIGWDGTENFFDPMCGSGTLLIEAACIATKRPPCLFRAFFGFMNWKNFDADLFMSLKKELYENIVPLKVQISGADIEMQNVSRSLGNIAKAKFEDEIGVNRRDFFRDTPPENTQQVVFNPPYGRRLELEDAKQFYSEMGDVFKQKYTGTKAHVITSNLEAFKFLGLRPSRKRILFNGPLECRLNTYEMYSGSKKDD